MADRIDSLAQQFEDVNLEFTRAVASISDEDWENITPAEQWKAGVTAHHVAVCYELAVDVLRALAAGEARPVTMRMLDELNAEHALQHADCTRAETVELLRSNGQQAAAAIRELPDDILDSTHNLPFLGEDPVTLEDFIKISFIGHHRAHLPSIQAASPSAAMANSR